MMELEVWVAGSVLMRRAAACGAVGGQASSSGWAEASSSGWAGLVCCPRAGQCRGVHCVAGPARVQGECKGCGVQAVLVRRARWPMAW